MAEDTKKYSAPYTTFGSFINFINKLKDNGTPSRIDKSVFGAASGSVIYSIMATLKSLKLINDDGIPSAEFKSFVESDDQTRKIMLKKILRTGYPSLWDNGINLQTVTAGQFDEHLKDKYDSKGSTIDKAAAFFIAAANYAEEPISTHLKARKLVASSVASRKNSKSRIKATDSAEGEDEEIGDDDQQQPIKSDTAKPLEYQLIDLMKEPDVENDIKQSIWNLVQYLTARNAKK